VCYVKRDEFAENGARIKVENNNVTFRVHSAKMASYRRETYQNIDSGSSAIPVAHGVVLDPTKTTLLPFYDHQILCRFNLRFETLAIFHFY